MSLLLVAGVLALYAPVQKFSFISADDPQCVMLNVHVMAGLSAKSVAWAFQSINVFYWEPLTWLSHMLDVTLYGLNAAGHHFTSVLWHALNGVLLFLILGRATGKLLRSGIVAALFAVHPLNLESVVWIAERKTVLCTFFFLLTLAAYGWYAARISWRRYLLALLCFALALMAKPIAVMLPLVLFLVDYWPLERTAFPRWPLAADERKQVLLLVGEKVPFAVLAVVGSVVTYLGQKSEGAVITQSSLPFSFRMANAIYSYCAYIGALFWPQKLSVFYPMPQSMRNHWQVLLAAVALAGITGAVFLLRKHRYLLTGWLWFLVVLLPMIGLVQVGGQSRADRHVYIPMMGLLVLIVWAVAEGCKKLHIPVPLCWAGAMIAVALLAWDARLQMRYWHDSVTLFARSLEVTPQENYFAHMNLATALAEKGRFNEAMPHFEIVYQRFPNIPEFREWAANVRVLKGHPLEAIPEYEAALSLAHDPSLEARLHYELGLVLLQNGNLQDAEPQFRSSIRLDPANSVGAYRNLGYILEKKGRLDEAIDQYSRSVEILPTVQAYVLLANALQQANRNQEAETAYRNALKLDPRSKEIQQKLQQFATPSH